MNFRTFQSRISHHVLTIAAVCLVGAPPASAQVAFDLTGGWQVGPTQLSSMRGLSSVRLPCVVSGEFDNGFVIRFSGGDGNIMAMAVDFRQNVFREGRKYSAMIALGDSYVKQVSGSAFTANTMIFNLRAIDDFYEQARQARDLELSIAGNAMSFSLPRFGEALKQMERCYAGSAAQEPKIAAPAPQDRRQELPQSYDDIVRNAPAPVATQSPMNIAGAAQQPAHVAQWNARAGEDMRSVLNRWADRAGYDLQWQAEHNGIVAQDMAFDGTFEEAVGQLLATSGAASGIAGRIDASAFPVPQASPPAQSTAQNNFADGGSWVAQSGASLQSVLEGWAAQAGVAILWNGWVDANVKQSLAMNGSFESAVQALLDQYTDESVRPVGSLNVDPQSGARTLTIELDVTG